MFSFKGIVYSALAATATVIGMGAGGSQRNRSGSIPMLPEFFYPLYEVFPQKLFSPIFKINNSLQRIPANYILNIDFVSLFYLIYTL